MEDAKSQLHHDVGVVAQPSSETIFSGPQDPLSYSLPADMSSYNPVDDGLAAFKVSSSSEKFNPLERSGKYIVIIIIIGRFVSAPITVKNIGA